MKTALLTTILVSATFILCVVIISLVVVLSPNTGGAKDYGSILINKIDRTSIDHFLRNLTKYPHPAGSDRTHNISKIIKEKWQEHGLQNVSIMSYNVYLSEADPENMNYFTIGNATHEIHTSTALQPPVDEFPQEDQDTIFAFNAYSANKVVNSSNVVYANYGRLEDFNYLEHHGIIVNETIVIIRYGKIFRGDKVRLAAQRGVLGVILYTDPADAAPEQEPGGTYPDTIYAPSGAIQLGSIALQGDLLTPGYPSTDYAFRIPQGEIDVPKIPVQPVSYADAYYILSMLPGDEVLPEWKGGLDITYRYGNDDVLPDGNELVLSVSNVNSFKNIYNVIGSIPGLEEPDRYVLIGNHHDAWTYGGIDPSSATANMLELTRVFGNMYKEGWRPRRTLVFCSWDAEESGLIGSTEFAEQFRSTLKDRAVVYLNLDMVMSGNYSFAATGLPHLSDIMYWVAQKVPNPDSEQFEAGQETVYDTWCERFPNEDPEDPEPVIGPLGTGSDYRAYVYNLGIPALDLCFSENPDEPALPLYHTAYETYELATRLMDVGLYYHEASARLLGLLAHEFSCRYPLPINVIKLGQFVQNSVKEFKTTYKDKFVHFNFTMDSIEKAANTFTSATEKFWEDLNEANLENELTLRRFNDAMMLMDKSLLAVHGLPRRPYLNHVLIAPSVSNQYVWEIFPGLQDYIRDEANLTSPVARRGILEHCAAIAYHLNMAADSLQFKLW